MKLSKLLFALACIASTCCIYATSVWDGTAEMWTVGSGTESDPYQIQTAQNLAYLAQSVNSGNSYSDKFFIQTDDINLNNIEWTSIGGQYDRVNYETSHFDASFDGANHSISNVKISGVGDGTYGVGLFGYCKGGGALKNINATVDVNFSNSNSVGGIVGYSEVPMVNCSARGTINYSSVGVGTGGVAGYSGSEMSLCINYCDITGDGSSAVGGVVGRANHGGGLSYCTNYGDIKSELGGYYYFGGVVAECDGNINGCVNYGDVSGAYYCSGVVVYASSSNSTISLCKNFGNITAGYENNQERSYATGVVYSSSGDVNDCVNYGNVSSNYESCGIANMAGGIIEKCSNHGAVSAISTQSSDENVYASGINMSGNISDCYNTGTITATSDNPDAVSHAYGCSRSGQVFNTYNAGKLIGDDNYGLVDDDESVTNSFYLESCGGSGAGISISSEQMQSSSFIEALDTESGAVFVSDVDGINNGYPILYLEQTFNVVFKNYDGAVLQSEKLLYDNMPVYKGQTPIRQSDAQYSYSFSGWDPAIERVSESQDYVAVYTSTVNKYEIRFVNYDGTVLQKSDVGYGEIPVYTGSTPVRPSESGNTYTFTGWSPELIAVNGAATYVATYRVVGTVKDRCSNTYNYVKIGSQYWMTENMRCTVYDTQSEQAGKTISYIRYDYPKQNQPYYTNYSDTSAGGDCVPSYIPEDVKSKLGLLYNWAAAVGLQNESEIESTTTDFSGIRQGICPNGWHIPTSAEWKSLRNYIEKVDGKGTDSAGKHLKSTVGWNSDGNGLDTYGFAVVPSGWSIDYAMSNVGVSALLVSATANSEQKIVSYSMSFSRDNMNEVTSFDKKYAYGVRCVKSAQFEVRFVNYNGDLLQIKELNYGEMPSYTGSTPTKPADAQYSYSFSGWSPTISAVTKDQIYTAQFSSTVNKYVIRFLNEDGTVLQTENLDYGTIPVYKGETPTKQPTAQYTYTFNGWDSEIGKVTGAKDYIATYSS
ncbi:MAG: FISUMP domain-containing protein, partial [Bacteroidales bacterium]|nr:FISUMP domain-containing protein [Bacteroidales bacterium]